MQEDSVIKIQSFVKAALTHKDYKTLSMYNNIIICIIIVFVVIIIIIIVIEHGDKPSLAMIRKYVHLLDVTEEDYAQQIGGVLVGILVWR